VAGDFLDDDEWSAAFPTKHGILQEVYCKDLHSGVWRETNKWLPPIQSFDMCGEGDPHVTDKGGLPLFRNKDTDQNEIGKADLRAEVFRAQETTLLSSSDPLERVRQLHEQLIVLQGATLNFGLCSILCLFGLNSAARGKSPKPWAGDWRAYGVFLVSLGILLFAVWSIYFHMKRGGFHLSQVFQLDDPPIMEGVLFTVGIVGLLVSFRRPVEDLRPRRWLTYFLLSFLLALFAFGGWWWSEVNYDENVIHSFKALGVEQLSQSPDPSSSAVR